VSGSLRSRADHAPARIPHSRWWRPGADLFGGRAACERAGTRRPFWRWSGAGRHAACQARTEDTPRAPAVVAAIERSLRVHARC
jgi:hypothetical protein